MKYLLDTCVISELVAKRPNPKVVDWIDQLDPDSVYLSVITIGEICKGIEKLPDSSRKTALLAWLTEELLSRFSARILSTDTAVMLEWGQLIGGLELQGQKMPAIDSLIAATARHYHCHLVTRNEQDFQQADVVMINPWD